MSPEPEPAPQLPLKMIEEIILSEDFLMQTTTESQLAYFIDQAKRRTCGQRNNPAWHQTLEREADSRQLWGGSQSKASHSLIKRPLGEYNISKVRAVAWGVDNESLAIQCFTRMSGIQPVGTGLWLDKGGVLGASPDGLIGDDGVLEVKSAHILPKMN